MAKTGSMASLQERGKGDFPGGKVENGTGLAKGSSGGGVNSSKGLDKFHNRPGNKEFSVDRNTGDGLSK